MFRGVLLVLVVVTLTCGSVGCNRKPDPRTQPGFQDTSDPSTITRVPPDPTKTDNPLGTGGSGTSNR